MNLAKEFMELVFWVVTAGVVLVVFGFLINGLVVIFAPLVNKPQTFRVNRKFQTVELLRPRDPLHVPRVIAMENGQIVVKRYGVETAWSMLGGARTILALKEVRPADETEKNLYLEHFPGSS